MLSMFAALSLSLSPGRPFASAPIGPRLRRSGSRARALWAQLSDEAPDIGGLEAEVRALAVAQPTDFSASRLRSFARSWLALPMVAPQRQSLFDRRANLEPPLRRERDAVDPLGQLTREDTQLFQLPKMIGGRTTTF